MLIQWGTGRQRLWARSNQEGNGGVWVVVVHGGAWRDPRITHESAFDLFKSLDPQLCGGFASVDYRLSPAVVHPAHKEDVTRGIEELVERYHPCSIVLVGHSCGAFLCGQVYPAFSKIVTGIVCVEGIYDLKTLLAEYPSYNGFVTEAFGTDLPSVNWDSTPVKAIVHSSEDELLSLRQPEWLADRTGVVPYILSKGKHDEVYEKLGSNWSHLID